MIFCSQSWSRFGDQAGWLGLRTVLQQLAGRAEVLIPEYSIFSEQMVGEIQLIFGRNSGSR